MLVLFELMRNERMRNERMRNEGMTSEIFIEERIGLPSVNWQRL
jgi:hypothetical protein